MHIACSHPAIIIEHIMILSTCTQLNVLMFMVPCVPCFLPVRTMAYLVPAASLQARLLRYV